MSPRLTHLDEKGAAHIVDISGKAETRRRAVARAELHGSEEVVSAIFEGGLAKGDALATARIAGIMAAKKTAELIPLCHPIPVTRIAIAIERIAPGVVRIEASVETTARTGVEMEALTAASVAALTLYDMGKALDRSMSISNIALWEKSGGASGDFARER